MRKCLIILSILTMMTATVNGEDFTSEAIYSHPLIVGIPPSSPVWSPDNKKLAFLWNAEGSRFDDLYFCDYAGRITRLTDMKNLPRNVIEDDDRSVIEIREQQILDGGLSGPFWSKDSKQIYFSFRGDLFCIKAKAGSSPQRLFQTFAYEGNYSISQDGQWIAYTSGNDIYARVNSSGRIVQLTKDGSSDIRNGTGAYDTYLSGVFWSPDSKMMAFVQHDVTSFQRLLIPDYTGEKVVADEQQREIAGGKLPTIKLGVVTPDSAHLLPRWMDLPVDEQFYLRSIDWSADSKKILFEVMNWDMHDRYILLAEVESGNVDTLWHEKDDCWIPRNMARVRFAPGDKEVIFASEMSGWCHLYAIPVEGSEGIMRSLTSGEFEIPSGGWGARNDWRISKDQNVLHFISSEDDPAERHVYRMNLPDGDRHRITAEPGWIRQFSISEDGSKAAIIFGDLDNPYDLYICDARSEKPMNQITWSAPDAFENYDWFKPEYISIPTSDGKSFPAKLWLPDGGGTPAPLIVYIHGAGYHQNVDKSAWGYEDRFHRMLVQHGFAIVDIDYRGSSGYGRDWRVEIFRHTGGKDLDDAVDAANYCVVKGWGIEGKVGIWGWSYGGFLTNMAMFKRPDIFKVGCSVAAVNDWRNYNLEYTAQRFKDPIDDPEAYAQSSPVDFAGGLEGKLLLIHGMKDDNVHVQDTIQLIDKLIRLGKDFDLLLYPRERHGFSRDESDVHVMRSMMNYFEEHLK